MSTAIKSSALLFALLLLSGCNRFVPGLLYTHTVRPRSIDFDGNPVGTKRTTLDEYRISEPLSGAGLSVEWTADRIREAAKAAGIEHVAFTEEETLSFILGIYQRRRLIIYGD